MTRDKIQYVIFVDQKDEKRVMLASPLKRAVANYLVNGILPTMRPLSDEAYMQGPGVVLSSLARFSYILYKSQVYWCVEWPPGLIVIRFSPDGTMAWSALRSPIPGFGGRTPNEEDLRNYDGTAENHQYRLVFDAWDAQFHPDPSTYGFKQADKQTAEAYQAALQHVQSLGNQMKTRYSGGDEYASWVERCKRNLAESIGDGIRIPV